MTDDQEAPGRRLLLGELDSVSRSEFGREDVEPYVAALLQAEHVNLLVGAGLTIGLCHLAGQAPPDMNAQLDMDDRELSAAIEKAAGSSAQRTRRHETEKANIEDRLRVAIEAAAGLRIVSPSQAAELETSIGSALTDLAQSVSSAERAILAAADERVEAQTILGMATSFFRSMAGRVPTRDRLHIFTTNYDRVIEWACEGAGIRLLDRFVGSLRPIFRSSRLEIDYHYSPPGSVREPRHLDGVVRLTKLHGSLDWAWDEDSRSVVKEALPFGVAPTGEPRQLLVFPNQAKDLETSFYPYADLFRDFSAALCRPNSALITYGYSFGDEHINRVVRDMLAIPSTHLLIIAYDDETGRIERFMDEHVRRGQISLMLGPEFADLSVLTQRWLPWPSSEFLLQRRAEITRRRQGLPHATEASDEFSDPAT